MSILARGNNNTSARIVDVEALLIQKQCIAKKKKSGYYSIF
jgi:hypothetical protein